MRWAATRPGLVSSCSHPTHPPLSHTAYPIQFIGWLSKLRRQYGKIFRIFTGARAYIVLMDKIVRSHRCRRRAVVVCTHRFEQMHAPSHSSSIHTIPWRRQQAAREALSDPRTFVKGPDYKEKVRTHARTHAPTALHVHDPACA